jgi:hypothetical protein
MFYQLSSKMGQVSFTHDAIEAPLSKHVDLSVLFIVGEYDFDCISATIQVAARGALSHS